jgi:hypothetical protein
MWPIRALRGIEGFLNSTTVTKEHEGEGDKQSTADFTDDTDEKIAGIVFRAVTVSVLLN